MPRGVAYRIRQGVDAYWLSGEGPQQPDIRRAGLEQARMARPELEILRLGSRLTADGEKAPPEMH